MRPSKKQIYEERPQITTSPWQNFKCNVEHVVDMHFPKQALGRRDLGKPQKNC